MGIAYVAALAIAACFQIVAMGWSLWEARDFLVHLLNPWFLIASLLFVPFTSGLVIPALVFAALALLSRFVFGVRPEAGLGGRRRRASAWMLLAFAVCCTGRFHGVEFVVQSVLAVTFFAMRDLRGPGPAWIVPTVGAYVAFAAASLAFAGLVHDAVGVAATGLGLALAVHAGTELRERIAAAKRERERG